ncbi:hypothetical protein [Flaviaesturariibacter amylovorans]|uniref:Uncharacterized protein n=1 Tax=Flaviaesturariibacter amylovorans TaxID=1084520 RepID=A0ABP8GMV8_9BACT
MKSILLVLFFTIAYLALGRNAHARATRSADTLLQAAAETGYWVVESNLQRPKEATVYFYNAGHELVYQEALHGVRLNLDRPRTVRRLNNVLRETIDAHSRKRTIAGSGTLLASQFAR